MKKRYLKQLLAFVLCAFAVLNSAAAFAAGSNETAASGITVESANGAERVIPSIVSADEWEVLRLVNSERSARGLSPLTTFSTLQSGAEIRAREIVTLFSHTRPLPRLQCRIQTFDTRIRLPSKRAYRSSLPTKAPRTEQASAPSR